MKLSIVLVDHKIFKTSAKTETTFIPIIDSEKAAKIFIDKPRRIKSRQKEKSVVERWEISSESENENEAYIQNDVNPHDFINRLQIKKEQNKFLQTAVNKLNIRLGTEIVDDDENAACSFAMRRYENSMNVNTLHYQRDADLGQKFFFVTNVKWISTFFSFY